MKTETFEKLLKSRKFYAPETFTAAVKRSEITNADIVDGGKIEYVNAPVCFDIETSSFYQGDKKCAVMYAWTLCLCGVSVIGRTWDEFLTCAEKLAEILECGKDRRLVVYVHNLSYEFQFLSKKFDFVRVFAVDNRKPIYAVTSSGIEFRCSYMLSGCSLENIGKFLNTYSIKKLTGDLDYTKIRHTKTALTKKEIGYILNDGKTVCAYIQEQIEKWGDISEIPMTKTGIVRRYARNYCLNGEHGSAYMDLMRSLTMNEELYKVCKRAFAGGFTHANALNAVGTHYDVASYDFSSSYPAVMCSEKFPMGKPQKVSPKSMEEFVRYINDYCCVFDIELRNIKQKEFVSETIISASRCMVKENAVLDNGRIAKADRIITTITDIDLWCIERFYDFDEDIRVANMWVWKKHYLPKPFIECILNLYRQKTELKGVSGKETEYIYIKELLNSFYGMCVTDISRAEHTFDTEWVTTPQKNISRDMSRYNTNKTRFLYYPWGVFVTAYARKNLLENILACGDDYIYSDTDSIKILNYEDHKEEIEEYNARIKAKLTKMCKYYNIDLECIEPVTVKGKRKPLGAFDFEGVYDRFKTLGAKRYIYEKDGKLTITIAGVSKSAKEYFTKGGLDPFDIFRDGLEIPAEETQKLTHTYIDSECSGTVTDYNGVTADFYENGYVHLEPAAYTLGMQGYIDYITKAGNIYV